MHLPINQFWNTIRKIEGKGSAKQNKHLKLGNHIITNKKEISNIIGQPKSKNSLKVNPSP